MNKQKALEITQDRIANIKHFVPTNESEQNIAKETLEYLRFIEKILED